MIKNVVLLTVASVIITNSISEAISVPFITKCKSNDADCITANAARAIPFFAEGIPELGINRIDPVFYELVDNSKPGLKLIFTNFTVIGMKDCKALDVHRNVPKSKLHIEIMCTLQCNGYYELSGKVLGVDMNGSGALTVHLRQIHQEIDADFVVIDGPDSKKHFNIKNYTYKYDLKEKSDVEFKNLHASDENLTKAIHETIKDNGNAVVAELGGPIFEAAYARIIKSFNNFFNGIPVEELSID